MQTERPAHVLAVPQWTLAIHAVQVLLAIIILGLNAYGIHWISYNVLIYSLVVCLCTLGVCAYMIVSSVAIHKSYNYWAFLALHIWMVIFWIVQFSLVANLAAIWAAPTCGYSYYSGYYCYKKRSLGLDKRDSTTYGAYFGALVAAAVFGAFEFISWLASLIILSIHLHRHRSAGNPSAPPPVYTGASMGNQPVPMEKYNHQAPAQNQYPTTPQPQYTQPAQQQNYSPQPQPPQPVYNQPPNPGPQFTTPYTQPQDPVNRVSSISPITVGGQTYPSPNTAELASPQHTGNYNQNLPPHAAELNTTPSHPTNAAELGNTQNPRYG